MRACRPQDAGPARGRAAGSAGSALRERGHGGGDHPVPSRTRQLSPPSPRVLQRQAAGGQDAALAQGASVFCGSAARPPSGGLPFFRALPAVPSAPRILLRRPFVGLFCFLGPNQCEGAQTASGVACTVCCRFHYRVLFWFAHFLTLRIPSSPQFLRAEILALVGQIFISSIMRRAVRRLAASACSIGLGETFLRRQSCDAILTFRAQFMMLRMRN